MIIAVRGRSLSARTGAIADFTRSARLLIVALGAGGTKTIRWTCIGRAVTAFGHITVASGDAAWLGTLGVSRTNRGRARARLGEIANTLGRAAYE